MPSPTKLQNGLCALIEHITTSPEIAARASGAAQAETARLLATYANEARIGLQLIEPLLRPGLRVLEVGCGIGVLARLLADSGYDVVGIEPGAAGFGFMAEIGAAIQRLEPAKSRLTWLEIAAGELDPARHGRFELIYSTNVLEHIPDLDEAFRGMASVLAPAGVMVHMCPNYFVPYEPHFGLPLLPLYPRATRAFFPRAIARYPGVWEELNFITAHAVKRLAARHGLSVSFDRRVMGRALRRYDEDELFRQRQGVLAGIAQRILVRTGMASMLDRLPGELASPMVMRLGHTDSQISLEVARTDADHKQRQMPQRTTGLYRLTQTPRTYEALQLALGARAGRRALVKDYICLRDGERVLDLGCGSAAILPYLGKVSYVGIDLNPAHIARARADHGDRGRFHAGDFASLRGELAGRFELVLCLGLLHHLDDERVGQLASLAQAYLAPGGRLVAVDPVFADGQSRIARWLAAMDAGACVRTAAAYRALLASAFPDCRTHVRHDLLRIPYSHCITVARRQ